MIKHIVLFKLKEMPEKLQHLQDIKNELERLTSIIPELQELKVGINANPAETWDFCLEAIVADLEAFATANYLKPGSSCLVIGASEIYMMDSEGNWRQL